MKILGIDPGTATTGFAIVEKQRGQLTAPDYGVIKTPASMEMAHRLLIIADDLKELIEKYQPKKLVIEKLFFVQNITNGITVAQARGVVLHTAASYGLSIREVAPTEVKKLVTGNGQAKKAQVQRMVKEIYQLETIPKPDDVADALAIAYAGV